MFSRFRRTILLCSVAFLVVTHAWGQSNDRIDELLAQDPAEMGHTAYLVLTAAGLIDEDASPSEAVQYAVSEGMIAAEIGASDATTFGAFSYLLTRSFNIPGGVMYRIAPGPRYAAREVVYQRWSRRRRETGELINGETVIRILSVYLNEEGGAQ